MPSVSPKQARFMRAVAHGWKPDRVEGPTRRVAREFVRADQRADKYAAGGAVPPMRGAPPGKMTPMFGPRTVGPQGPLGVVARGAPPRMMPARPNPMMQTARRVTRPEPRGALRRVLR